MDLSGDLKDDWRDVLWVGGSRLVAMTMMCYDVVRDRVRITTQKGEEVLVIRKQEGKMLSVVQEVLGSIRVVKAFARENYEIQRLEGESLETVDAALKARRLKAPSWFSWCDIVTKREPRWFCTSVANMR